MNSSAAVTAFEGLIQALVNVYQTRGIERDDLLQEARAAVLVMEKPFTKRTVSDAVRNRLRTITRRYVDERKLTVSMDATSGVDDEGESTNLHDFVGEAPIHEVVMLHNRVVGAVDKTVKSSKVAAASRGKSSQQDRIITMRAEGASFSEIGAALGVSKQAVRQAWLRAQKNIDRREVA